VLNYERNDSLYEPLLCQTTLRLEDTWARTLKNGVYRGYGKTSSDMSVLLVDKTTKKAPPENLVLHIVKREKTNKMQQSDVYYQLMSQHVLGIIMPIFRRTKTVCYCIWCTALVLLDVVGSSCGVLRCRMRAL